MRSHSFIRSRRVGGIRFIWIGRLVLSYCVSKRVAAPCAPRAGQDPRHVTA